MNGDTIYAWQVLEDGEWGIIAASFGQDGPPLPLVTRSLVSAQSLGVYAVSHHDATGFPVRCVRFDCPVVLREIP